MTYQFKEQIPVFCPRCARVPIAKSFDGLIKLLRLQWDIFLKTLPDSDFKRKLIAEMAMYNAPKKLKKTLAEHGYLVAMCQDCITDLSEEYYNSQGLPVVRIGHYIFDEKFFNANSKEILERLNKK